MRSLVLLVSSAIEAAVEVGNRKREISPKYCSQASEAPFPNTAGMHCFHLLFSKEDCRGLGCLPFFSFFNFLEMAWMPRVQEAGRDKSSQHCKSGLEEARFTLQMSQSHLVSWEWNHIFSGTKLLSMLLNSPANEAEFITIHSLYTMDATLPHSHVASPSGI